MDKALEVYLSEKITDEQIEYNTHETILCYRRSFLRYFLSK